MTAEKQIRIRDVTKTIMKLPKDKQMFVFGIAQGLVMQASEKEEKGDEEE